MNTIKTVTDGQIETEARKMITEQPLRSYNLDFALALSKWVRNQMLTQNREYLLKLIQEARKGSMVTSGLTGNIYWKFDVDSESKIVADFIKIY